jgi:hypothetical protein
MWRVVREALRIAFRKNEAMVGGLPRDAFVLGAEHVRQLEGESPFDNLMEVKS